MNKDKGMERSRVYYDYIGYVLYVGLYYWY